MPDDLAAFLISQQYNAANALKTLHTLLNRYPQFALELNDLWMTIEDEQRKVTELLEP